MIEDILRELQQLIIDNLGDRMVEQDTKYSGDTNPFTLRVPADQNVLLLADENLFSDATAAFPCVCVSIPFDYKQEFYQSSEGNPIIQVSVTFVELDTDILRLAKRLLRSFEAIKQSLEVNRGQGDNYQMLYLDKAKFGSAKSLENSVHGQYVTLIFKIIGNVEQIYIH